MAGGRSVRLFLAEGTATGVLTAEIVNWTGHVLSAPRSKLDVAMKREEIKRTGIYILFGTPLDSDLPAVYVGEGDDISTRLYQHARDVDKTYWERFVAITNKDMNLTKAHVKYLEGRLITLLKEAKKSLIMNKTDPAFDKLPEADISDMETFLEELQLVLPVIGVDFFRRPPTRGLQDVTRTQKASQSFVLVHPKKGISAKAIEADGEFVLLTGSQGDLNEAASFHDKLRALRHQLIETGRMTKKGESNFVLSDDVAFSSPSAASVFLFGTSRNGRTDWLLDGSSKTYGEWKDASLTDTSGFA